MPLWKKPEKQSLVLIAYDVDNGEKKAEFYCDEGGVISEIINNLVPASKNDPNQSLYILRRPQNFAKSSPYF